MTESTNTILPARIGSDAGLAVIRELERKLADANEELSQFNYHVSHDLVAPISSARGLLHLMQDDLAAGITDELSELLNDAQGQLQRLENLVADLMSLARAGVEEQNISRFGVRELIDEIVASLSMHAQELEISVTLRADEPILIGDRVRVQQILANLISNARKFVDPDELAPEITVSCVCEGNGTSLSVSDNGIGIDPAIVDKLFGLFVRGTGKHGRNGHGLGLYIVGKHVARLGGTVAVTSYSKPTVFKIFLPTVGGTSCSDDSMVTGKAAGPGSIEGVTEGPAE